MSEKPKLTTIWRNLGRARQTGQSSVEYLVVIAAFTGTFALAGNVDALMQAIRNYFTDYSYAMSVAQVPDCVNTYGASAGPVSGSATVDKCPDINNPAFPITKVTVDWNQD